MSQKFIWVKVAQGLTLTKCQVGLSPSLFHLHLLISYLNFELLDSKFKINKVSLSLIYVLCVMDSFYRGGRDEWGGEFYVPSLWDAGTQKPFSKTYSKNAYFKQVSTP